MSKDQTTGIDNKKTNETGRLAGRVAIITGAGSGIGRATAGLFAQEGAKVLAVDLDSSDLLSHFEGNENVECLLKDISADSANEHIVGTAIDAFGQLDILMNNAAMGSNFPAESFPQEIWEKVLNVNLTAPFRICQAAIPHLKQSDAGRIINVASVMATHTDYGLAAYSAAKAGITGFTRNLALELGRDGITVNAILPGAIETGMTSKAFADETVRGVWAKKSPLKRLGQPIDIAQGALFLASEDSSFVTGHNLNVDGGLLLRS